MRRPLFLAGLLVLVVAFGLELGSGLVVSPDEADPAVLADFLRDEGFDADERQEAIADAQGLGAQQPPGLAVRSLALVDALLLVSLVLLALAIAVPHRVHSRISGIVNLVAGIAVIVLAIAQLLAALVLLQLMLGLFLSPPFGTLTYLAVYGFFDRPGAALILGVALALKIAFVVLALLAYPRFARERSLVLLVATSIGLVLLVTFLHGAVPLVLVSILDAVAAIIVSIAALVWAVPIVVMSLVSIASALRVRLA